MQLFQHKYALFCFQTLSVLKKTAGGRTPAQHRGVVYHDQGHGHDQGHDHDQGLEQGHDHDQGAANFQARTPLERDHDLNHDLDHDYDLDHDLDLDHDEAVLQSIFVQLFWKLSMANSQSQQLKNAHVY